MINITVVGVKVNNELYTPIYSTGETKIVTPAGRDLSNVKLQLLVANGELDGFVNEKEYDSRKPLDISLKGYDGTNVQTKLRIQSPPKLSNFIIEGINVPAEDVHTSANSIIAQVPPTTDLSALKVTMIFVNGTLVNFENGKELNYNQAHTFNVKGVDEETLYPYELIITTDPVGPAFVKSMTFDGVKTDSIIVNGNTLTPYVPALLNFSSVDIEIETGFGNRIDPSFSGNGLNMITGTNKVKITGTNGVETEFTIAVPQLSFAPLFGHTYTGLGFAANDLSAIGFSGEYLLVANYSAGNKLPVLFDMDGERISQMDATGVDPTGYGIRKFATDEKGAVLMLSLGMSSGDQWVYKFDSATGKGSKYLSFSQASLGVDYAPRSAGINISGSLDGDAIITIGIAQKTDIFVWEVKNGILNNTPKKYAFPYTGTSYYWSVQPMPVGVGGFTGFATSNNANFGNGIICFGETMAESQKITGVVVTDGKTIKHNNRIYLAYTTHANNSGLMRICDITSGDLSAYKNPIFNQAMEMVGANGNATVDADFTVINGKLHVAFACTNLGVYVYCLE